MAGLLQESKEVTKLVSSRRILERSVTEGDSPVDERDLDFRH